MIIWDFNQLRFCPGMNRFSFRSLQIDMFLHLNGVVYQALLYNSKVNQKNTSLKRENLKVFQISLSNSLNTSLQNENKNFNKEPMATLTANHQKAHSKPIVTQKKDYE